MNYLDIEPNPELRKSKVVILPVPYEGTVTYGKGTSKGPQAIIDASSQLETYDEELRVENFDRIGIHTTKPLKLDKDPKKTVQIIKEACKKFIDDEKFVIMLGGEHSISFGYYWALKEKYPDLAVIQLDAHADLRNEYEDSKFSHACVMRRIRETCKDTLQIGIRSHSKEESDLIRKEKIPMFYAHYIYIKNTGWLNAAIKNMPNNVFLTIDVDFFSWDVISDTGTPEPGGIHWYKALEILRTIFENKNVVGFDIVELSQTQNSNNSAFACAKLIYRLINYKFTPRKK